MYSYCHIVEESTWRKSTAGGVYVSPPSADRDDLSSIASEPAQSSADVDVSPSNGGPVFKSVDEVIILTYCGTGCDSDSLTATRIAMKNYHYR